MTAPAAARALTDRRAADARSRATPEERMRHLAPLGVTPLPGEPRNGPAWQPAELSAKQERRRKALALQIRAIQMSDLRGCD